MLLTLSLEDGLLHFLVILNDIGWILSGNLSHCIADFLFFLRVFCLDSAAVFVVREFNFLECDVCSRGAESNVCLCSTELDCTSYITGIEVGNLLLLLSGNCVDCRNSLAVSGLRILQIHALGKLAGHNLEICNLAEVLLYGSLIYKEGCRSILLALDFLGILCDCLLLGRRCSNADCELHKPLDSDVLLSREAEYRIDLTLTDTDSKALTDFILGKFACFEIFLHQSIVILGCTVDKRLTKFVCLVLELCRDVEVLTGSVLIREMVVFHGKHIHESVERRTDVHRELDDDRFVAEGLFHGLEGSLPVGLVTVQLVYSDDDRNIILTGIASENLGSNLDSLLCIDEKDSRVANLECRNCSTYEVIRTRSVYYIELGVHELGIKRSCID